MAASVRGMHRIEGSDPAKRVRVVGLQGFEQPERRMINYLAFEGRNER